MPDIYLDVAAASARMRSVEQEALGRQDAHAAEVPDFPVAAAGSGFAGHGARLQAAFARVHERGTHRLAALSATAVAAVEQFAQVERTDVGSAAAVDAVGEEL